MVFRAMTSVRLERETNHDLLQRTYAHSTIQYVSVNMRRPALSAWLVRLLQSQYSIHMKQTYEFTRKSYETDCTTHEVNLILQVSSELAPATKAANDLLSMVVSVIHLLPYICGKKLINLSISKTIT